MNNEETSSIEETIDTVKLDINKYSNENLVSIISCCRFFNFWQDLQLKAMEEVARRRLNGDDYNFEEKIDLFVSELNDQTSKSIPVFNIKGI